MQKNKESTPSTLGELIRKAKSLKDLGIEEIDESASEAAVAKNKEVFEHNRRDFASTESKRYIG